MDNKELLPEWLVKLVKANDAIEMKWRNGKLEIIQIKRKLISK